MLEKTKYHDHGQIVLRPNASLTFQQGMVVCVGFAVISLIIALFFWSLGCWMVLPFSGLEVLLFSGCMFYTLRQGTFREIITITRSMVRIEKGHRRLERSYEFQRAWVKVNWVQPSKKGHPSRLFIRSHGNEVEVGCFLVESEREILATELIREISVQPLQIIRKSHTTIINET